MENVIEDFYGVYLLYCLNPTYKGRTYIGYTVDPNRRINQHNKGKRSGGAWKTSERGPWEMVLVVHGFPNDISALRFEWAWQHPQISRHLRHVAKKFTREKPYDFCLRVLSEMLLVGPWNRLALTIRWLKQEYARPFPADRLPPLHMPVAYGPVVPKKLASPQKSSPSVSTMDEDEALNICSICNKIVKHSEKMMCLSPSCLLMVHVICLAKIFVTDGAIIPIEGDCPACGIHVLWGDLVRKKKGCYSTVPNAPS